MDTFRPALAVRFPDIVQVLQDELARGVVPANRPEVLALVVRALARAQVPQEPAAKPAPVQARAYRLACTMFPEFVPPAITQPSPHRRA